MNPIDRRSLMAAFTGAGASLLAPPALAKPAKVAGKKRLPNFIIILADDLGYGDFSATGSGSIKTPNIDKMASEGLLLTDAYASANICTPSRAGLLTGRYPIRTGLGWQVIQANDERGLPPSEVTIPEMLGKDYKSALIGKWHLGHVAPYWPPTVQGFDLFFGLPYSHDMKPLSLYSSGQGVEFTQEDVNMVELTNRFFARAGEFVDANRSSPFFLMLALTAPHIPLHPHGDHKGRSDAGAYGDVVEEIDTRIGVLRQQLETLGLADDTYVIITSDNGPWFEGSSGPLRDRKGGSGWDGGYRVPFVAWAPTRIPAGRRSNAITMNIDLLPTLAALASKPLPAGVVIDGKDISAMLHGDASGPHSDLILFDNEKVAGIRTDRWKYVARSYYREYDVPLARMGADLLFDVRSDPAENYNVASLYPDVAKEMRAKFERYCAEYEPLGVHKAPDQFPAAKP
jgi:arylsulfatase A